MLQVIRFHDLEPTWTTRRAREPGYLRWLVTWVGGPVGCINTNPGVAAPSAQCAIGLMLLPPGQRQAGRHIHGVTEIYVVLDGTLEGFDGTEGVHRAGPLDCTYTPPGCPHGVRNCGRDDVALVWIHDGIERNDAATYFDDDVDLGQTPPMQLVRWADLCAGARAAGTGGDPVEWVRRGAADEPGPGHAVHNDRVAVGLSVIEPGGGLPPERRSTTRFHLVVQGQAVLDVAGDGTVLRRLDGLNVPAGDAAALRNDGPDALHVLHVDCPA